MNDWCGLRAACMQFAVAREISPFVHPSAQCLRRATRERLSGRTVDCRLRGEPFGESGAGVSTGFSISTSRISLTVLIGSRRSRRFVVNELSVGAVLHRALAEGARADGRRLDRRAHDRRATGRVISPLLANLFLHRAFDMWLEEKFPRVTFERHADDVICHCRSEAQARFLHGALTARMVVRKLELHLEKTRIVYWKDANRPAPQCKVREAGTRAAVASRSLVRGSGR